MNTVEKINIILKLNQNFDRTKQTITQKADGTIEEGDIKTDLEGSLKIGTYQLFERDGSTKMNGSIINFFTQESDSKDIKKFGDKIETTFTYSAMTNFKRAIFTCENVTYNEITGRISSMTFKQI